MMKSIEVAAGVILVGSNILLSRRLKHAHQGGKWEFPGGKLEAGETSEAALLRELTEELGIQLSESEFLLQTSHDYPAASAGGLRVNLHVFLVRAFAGEAKSCEGQEIALFDLEELRALDFPAANVPIIDYLYAHRQALGLGQ